MRPDTCAHTYIKFVSPILFLSIYSSSFFLKKIKNIKSIRRKQNHQYKKKGAKGGDQPPDELGVQKHRTHRKNRIISNLPIRRKPAKKGGYQ
jgi:hypothetical protein